MHFRAAAMTLKLHAKAIYIPPAAQGGRCVLTAAPVLPLPCRKMVEGR